MRHSWVCFIQLKTTKCESCVCLLSGYWIVLLFLCCGIVCRYGYLTNTKVKFILVTTDMDVKDADVRNVSLAFCLMLLLLKIQFVKLKTRAELVLKFFINLNLNLDFLVFYDDERSGSSELN